MHSSCLSRRRALLSFAGLATSPLCWPQPGRSAGAALVAQIVDMSAAQQDVSKDFLIGSRAAWQEINARGGLGGRPVQHQTLETDGSPASLQGVLQAVRDNPACVALSGTAGGAAASQLSALLRQQALDIAHAAPWLQNAGAGADGRTFSIFAPRQEQIAHALKSLSSMGVSEVGAIYATAQEQTLYREDVERTAVALKLRLQSYSAAPDLRSLGQRLTPGTPAILLYIGGTPELVQFTQGLEKQLRQRYVVALADVNLQTLQQLGAARQTPVIATQAVPPVSASLPLVRAYRETLARLFDEPPSPLRACLRSVWGRVGTQSGRVARQDPPHGLVPMQGDWRANRPISSPPVGQLSFRAVCGVAMLANSSAIGGAARLASHPEKTPARPHRDRKQALSLAGFIAARYTYEVLRSVQGPLTRQSALAAFARRAPLDLGGFRIRFDAQGRGSSYVTQSMLTTDGRVVG